MHLNISSHTVREREPGEPLAAGPHRAGSTPSSDHYKRQAQSQGYWIFRLVSLSKLRRINTETKSQDKIDWVNTSKLRSLDVCFVAVLKT